MLDAARSRRQTYDRDIALFGEEGDTDRVALDREIQRVGAQSGDHYVVSVTTV